ncbi:MAG: hypothetical protein Q7U03_09345 [Syntrophales bacterium]|nr:hypothetical protein [Syntrophales bacterium]
MTQFLYFLIISLFIFPGLSYSQDIRATTKDGREVLLKKDGTWKFYSGSKSSLASKSILYKRSNKATRVFNTKGDKFAVWYDPSKWTQQKLDSSSKITFNYKDGDLYGMVLAERISMDPDALKEMAISNALEVAPNTEVTLEENRVVNGKIVLCMRLVGTIKGAQFIYYGYYYTGKEGTIQVLTYTSQNLYPEYESEMMEFLNGLTINN